MNMLIKMSSGWFCQPNINLADEAENIKVHVENGDIVYLVESIETFVDEMGIEEEDIQIVD